MRKFIVYTRPLPASLGKTQTDAPAVVEVEGEVITGMEDPSVMWLPEGEYKFRITAPEWLFEPQEIKQADGSKQKVMLPPIYHSHALYDIDEDDASIAAETVVRENFEFLARKQHIEFTEEQVSAKLWEIQDVPLDI